MVGVVGKHHCANVVRVLVIAGFGLFDKDHGAGLLGGWGAVEGANVEAIEV